MSTTTPKLETLSARLQALEPRLRVIAASFSNRDPMAADDIYSEMVEAILTKCQPEYSDAMLLTKARWVAYDHVNSERIYTRYLGDEKTIELECECNDGGESFSHVSKNAYQDVFEYYKVDYAFSPEPEQALLNKETANELAQVVEQLTPTLQLVVKLIAKGYKPVEIARKMDISKSAVSQNIDRIQSIISININV